jgi:hypothetical protein
MITGAVAALAAGAVSFGMAIAPAGATALIGSPLCNRLAEPLCMTGSGVDGAAVVGEPNLSRGQDVELLRNTACGGAVTADCPFTPGLDLNNDFINDPIVTIENPSFGMNYRSNSAGTGVIEESGGGDGQLWVVAPAGLNGSILVNVFASDKLDTKDFYTPACTEGIGAQVALPAIDQGLNCQWSA